MPRTLLVSTRNSAYQVLESLRANRQKRHRSRVFLVEGVLPITRALAHGWTFEAVAYSRPDRLSSWARDVIARAQPPVQYALAPDLLHALSGKAESSELVAVVRMPADDVGRIISYAAAEGRKSFAALLPANAYGSVAEASFRRGAAAARHAGEAVRRALLLSAGPRGQARR